MAVAVIVPLCECLPSVSDERRGAWQPFPVETQISLVVIRFACFLCWCWCKNARATESTNE
jgi:hypothetical protein